VQKRAGVAVEARSLGRGMARILWDREDFPDLPGAERAVEIDEVVETAGQGPLGWRLLDYSPFNPR